MRGVLRKKDQRRLFLILQAKAAGLIDLDRAKAAADELLKKVGI